VVTASGSNAQPYTYAVSSGALPTGLSLNTGTGAITGEPTTAGTFDFTITAIDMNGCPGSRLYAIVIAAPGCPVITLSPITLPSGLIGTAYNQTIVASGGTGTYTYLVTGTLPNNLSLNPNTGDIAGTPNASGIFNFTITATDGNNCIGSRAYTIVIGTCPIITLSPDTLPNGAIGIPYNQTVSASGGTVSYTYSVAGTLPTGLSLNTSTGAITGKPTATGVFSFVITATDSNDCTGLKGYTMTIAAVAAVTDVPTLSEWGMIIFMALGGLMSVYYLRRRRM